MQLKTIIGAAVVLGVLITGIVGNLNRSKGMKNALANNDYISYVQAYDSDLTAKLASDGFLEIEWKKLKKKEQSPSEFKDEYFNKMQKILAEIFMKFPSLQKIRITLNTEFTNDSKTEKVSGKAIEVALYKRTYENENLHRVHNSEIPKKVDSYWEHPAFYLSND